jgi:MFS family permease
MTDRVRTLFQEPRWLALWAAMAGYALDAMDVLLYVFALQTLRAEFHLDNAAAGLVGSATLVTSAIGGIAAGVLADRIGRRRTLIYTILLYSLASAGTAFSRGLTDLLLWRAVLGLGLGGEWSAGATLVAESWPADRRAKAIGLMQSGWAIGYMLAAVLAGWILPRYGWRVLFLAGVLPALLTVAIQRKVSEPEVWLASRGRASLKPLLFDRELRRRTLLATALATTVQFAYWGLFTWLPGFLSAPRADGGAGLDMVRTSAWVFTMQIGTFLGYVSFGALADRVGRRPAFASYVVVAAILTPVFGLAPLWAGQRAGTALLMMGPLVGFFGSGYFSLFGTMLAELYPTAVRGAGQGFCYNTGRGLSALSPFAVGALADRFGVGSALALSSAFFMAGAVLVFLLPETRGTRLSCED